MSEQTLLLIVISILAFSWLMVAVVVTLVGVRVLRLLDEAQDAAAGLRKFFNSIANTKSWLKKLLGQ